MLIVWDESIQIVTWCKTLYLILATTDNSNIEKTTKALKNYHPRFTNDKIHMVHIQASCFSSQNHCQDFNELLMSIRNWLVKASDPFHRLRTASAPQPTNKSFLSALETEVPFTCLTHWARHTRQMFTFPDTWLHQETLHHTTERDALSILPKSKAYVM